MQKEGFGSSQSIGELYVSCWGTTAQRFIQFLVKSRVSAPKVVRDTRHLLSQTLTVEEGEADGNEYNKDDELKREYGTLTWSSEPQAELEMLAEGSSLQSKIKNIFLLWLRG